MKVAAKTCGEIESCGKYYERQAIPTHFVTIGESYIDLIRRYVLPVYEDGCIVSIGEKVISLCQKRVLYKKDMKVGFEARFLARFASKTSAGIGVNCPYKMQFAIDSAERERVLWASVCAGVGKLFGKKGIFYSMLDPEVSGLDGFYPDVFPVYGEYGIRLPEDPDGVCNEIYEKTGVKAIIVDANDFDQTILGKCSAITQTDAELKDLIRDNPAGQGPRLTPFVLIRKEEKSSEKMVLCPSGE